MNWLTHAFIKSRREPSTIDPIHPHTSPARQEEHVLWIYLIGRQREEHVHQSSDEFNRKSEGSFPAPAYRCRVTHRLLWMRCDRFWSGLGWPISSVCDQSRCVSDPGIASSSGLTRSCVKAPGASAQCHERPSTQEKLYIGLHKIFRAPKIYGPCAAAHCAQLWARPWSRNPRHTACRKGGDLDCARAFSSPSYTHLAAWLNPLSHTLNSFFQ